MRARISELLAAAAFVSVVSGAPAQSQCTPAEVAETLAPDAAPVEFFGDAVALQGDLAAVGAPRANIEYGAVYLLGRDVGGAGNWGTLETLEPTGPLSNKVFGSAVALSGDTLAVGAPRGCCPPDVGEVYVFERDMGGPDSWGLARVLTPPQALTGTFFGISVGLDGDTLAIGASGTEQVFVHERDAGGAGSWGLVQTLTPSGAGSNDGYGIAVALEGDTLAVGANQGDGIVQKTGIAYVYERSGTWSEVARLFAMESDVSDWYGTSLDLDGDTLAVSAPLEDHSGKIDAGAVYLYDRDASAGTWTRVGRAILGPNVPLPREDDRLGTALSLSENTLLAGAPDRQNGEGRVFLFSRDEAGPNAWQLSSTTSKIQASDRVAGSRFGEALALDGTRAVVGSPGHDHGIVSSGSVYLFEGLQAQPPLNYCTAGTSASGCAATLGASGDPSATAVSGFVVTATAVEGARDGLFFFGTSGQQANSWGSGTSYQCVVPPVVRGGLLVGTGTAGACDGDFSQDLAALWTQIPAKNPGPGAQVNLQLWYRDPQNTSNQTTSLSDGLGFVTCP